MKCSFGFAAERVDQRVHNVHDVHDRHAAAFLPSVRRFLVLYPTTSTLIPLIYFTLDHVDSWWRGLTKAYSLEPFDLSQGTIECAFKAGGWSR